MLLAALRFYDIAMCGLVLVTVLLMVLGAKGAIS